MDSNDSLKQLPEKITEDLASDIIVLTQPRPWLIEAILIFCSFGIYALFWLAFNVSDLKKITLVKYKPWLWFFVPSFIIAQLVALPKFTKAIEGLEEEHGIEPKKHASSLWICFVAGLTLYFNLSDKFETSFLLDVLALMAFGLTFSLYHKRIVTLKNRIPNIEFKERILVLKILDWLVILTFTPFLLWLAYEYSIKPMFNEKTNEFNRGEKFTSSNGEYEFTSTRDGWYQLPIGYYSDGSAEYEFQGPREEMYFLIFDHGINTNLDDVTYWRIEEVKSEFSNAECTHTRHLEGVEEKVVAIAYCEGSSLSLPHISVIKVISTPSGIFEIYGEFSSVKYTFREEKEHFINMAKGFQEKQ